MGKITIEEARADKFKMNDFIKENKGLVYHVMKKYNRVDSDIYEELYQECMVTMYNSIMNYDPSFNTAFSTYCIPFMDLNCKKYLRDHALMKSYKTPRWILKYYEMKDAGKTNEEIAKLLNLKSPEYVENVEMLEKSFSFDTTIYDKSGDDQEVDLWQTIDNSYRIEDEVIGMETIKKALSKLTANEKKVLVLNCIQDQSQVEISKIMSMSQAHVSRILKKARQKLCG